MDSKEQLRNMSAANKVLVGVMIVTLVGIVCMPTQAQDENTAAAEQAVQEPVVVRVNGVEVAVHVAAAADAVAQEQIIQAAIQKELLIQAAKKEGFDQHSEYAKLGADLERWQQAQQVLTLSRAYEEQELTEQGIWDLEVTYEEVDRYYAEHADEFKRLPPEKAREDIRRRLKAFGRYDRRLEWRKAHLQNVPVTIDGVVIAKEVLTAAFFPPPAKTPVRPPGQQPSAEEIIARARQAEEIGPLWQEIARIMKRKGVDVNDPTARKSLGDIVVEVGDAYRVPLGTLAAQMRQREAPDSSTAAPFHFSYLSPGDEFTIVVALRDYYITAAAAEQAGVTNDPEWHKVGSGLQAELDQIQRQTLIARYLDAKGGTAIKPDEIDQADVDAFYEADRQRFRKIQARTGRKGVDIAIRSILARQARKALQQEAIKELVANATIERVE